MSDLYMYTCTCIYNNVHVHALPVLPAHVHVLMDHFYLPVSSLSPFTPPSTPSLPLLQKLSSLGMDIARLHQETETFLRLAEDLKSASEQNENVFYEFYQQ